MSDKVEALERLGRLLDEGKISHAEYEKLKVELLESDASVHESSPIPSPAGGADKENGTTRSASTTEAGPYHAVDALEPISSILVIALWVNAVYWALESTIGFDLAFTPFFWGSSGVGDWFITIENLYPWVLISTGILFVIWSYKAHAGLRTLGRSGLRHQDHETVWWWVVPIANLVMPFKLMYETVRGTIAHLDDTNWQSQPVPPLVPWWVGTFLGGIVITGVSRGVLNTASTIEDWTAAATAYTLGSAAMTVAAVLAAKLTHKTTEGQATQIRRLVRGDSRPTSDVQSVPRAQGPRTTTPVLDADHHIDRLARGEYWKS